MVDGGIRPGMISVKVQIMILANTVILQLSCFRLPICALIPFWTQVEETCIADIEPVRWMGWCLLRVAAAFVYNSDLAKRSLLSYSICLILSASHSTLGYRLNSLELHLNSHLFKIPLYLP